MLFIKSLSYRISVRVFLDLLQIFSSSIFAQLTDLASYSLCNPTESQDTRYRRNIWSNESERQPSSFISLCLSDHVYLQYLCIFPSLLSEHFTSFLSLFFFFRSHSFVYARSNPEENLDFSLPFFYCCLLASLECWNKNKKRRTRREREKKRKKAIVLVELTLLPLPPSLFLHRSN